MKRSNDDGPRDSSAIFDGRVHRRTAVGEESSELRVTHVAFKNGARTKPHVHETEQVLIVIDGEGLVATGSEQHEIAAGDVAVIPAGERHWHGARAGHDMRHWSILRPGTTRVVD